MGDRNVPAVRGADGPVKPFVDLTLRGIVAPFAILPGEGLEIGMGGFLVSKSSIMAPGRSGINRRSNGNHSGFKSLKTKHLQVGRVF